MLLSFGADERAALRFDDLASALEAGLPLSGLGGDVAAGDRAVHELLRARGVRLSPVEDAVIAAGVRAGRIPEVLRQRAEQRRQRAAFARELWAGVRYPMVLLGLGLVTSLIVASVLDSYAIPLLFFAVPAALVLAALLFRRSLRTGGGRWLQVPWLGPLARAVGELPYLEALHALYASGVPIVEAHALATGAVGIVDLRLRLREVEKSLQAGDRLAEALARHGVLHDETRQLLTTGEAAGQLEEALQKALRRRREVCRQRIALSVRWFGGGLYGFVVLAVVWLIVRFYLNLFAMAQMG